jgi:hypothetical protein
VAFNGTQLIQISHGHEPAFWKLSFKVCYLQANLHTARPQQPVKGTASATVKLIPKALDGSGRCSLHSIFLALPRPERPILWAVKVVSLRDLHRAQTFRFPFVADKSAASALHPAL